MEGTKDEGQVTGGNNEPPFPDTFTRHRGFEKSGKTLANFLSTIFHPLFFPLYALLYIYCVDSYKVAGLDDHARKKFFAMVAVNTIIFPFLTVFIMRGLGFVNSILLRGRQERIIPFIASGMFYVWTFMVVRSIAVSDFITAVFLGATLSVFACFFFTLFFKISIHSAAAGGFIAIALALAFIAPHNLQNPLMAVIVIAGLM